MTKSKYTDRFWYFRNQADEDDDDGTGDSILIPVSSLCGFLMHSSNQRMIIYFEGMNKGNVHQNDGAEDGVDGSNGYVILNITAGKGKEVMQALVQAVNRGPHHDGITIIADDSTTDADGTTRQPVYIHKDILSVQHIENSVDGAI